MIITRPRASKKTPSHTSIRGIFEVGLRSSVRPQLSTFEDISETMNRIDLGIIGVHVRS